MGALLSAGPAETKETLGPTIPQIVEVSDIAGLAPSPDGSHVAFRVERADIGSNRYRSQWYVLNVAKRHVRELGSGGEPIYVDPGVSPSENPIWAADGKSIFYRALTNARVQVWQAEIDGSGVRAAIEDDADIVSIRAAADPGGLIYTVGATRDEIARAELEEYHSGILVDERVDLAQAAFRGAIINGRSATQRLAGNWFAREGLLARAPKRAWRYDSGTGARTAAPLESEKPRPTLSSVPRAETRSAQSARGDVVESSWLEGSGSLHVKRGAGAETIQCRQAQCRLRTAWLSWQADRDAILFATRDISLSQALHVWDLKTGNVRTLATSTGLLSGGRDESLPCAISESSAVCVAASAGSPPRLEIIDLASGGRSAVFDPNPELRASMAALGLQPLKWTGSAGHEYNGWLFSPKGSASSRLPLFINYNRCEGFLRGGVGDEWPLATLAAAGIRAACINATSRKGKVDATDNSRAALEGVRALVEKMSAGGRVDPAKVGMGGLSFGSEATMWTVANSNLLAAASITAPVFEPTYYWYGGVRGRDNHKLLKEFWGLGAPEETPDQWKLLAPAFNIERVRTPLLLQMPEQESRVMMELYSKLTNTTTPAELYVFPDEGHLKVQPKHRFAVNQRNFDWFRFWLQGIVDPAPAKGAQYKRWQFLEERFLAGAAEAKPPS